jgi:hypothetical protein
MRKLVFAIATVSLLSACGSSTPGVYDLPIPEALARLQKADLDGFRMARQCGMLIHIAASEITDNAITWRITSSGQQVLRFTVKLVQEANGTRAIIEVPADPKGGEVYDGDKFYPRPAVNQPLRPAIQELIDSAIAQRPYEGQKLVSADRVCSIQRGGLESGHYVFGVDDRPGMDSRESRRADELEAAQTAPSSDFDSSFGKPMDDARGSR